ncbi:hypothetical protein KAM348_41410 [Aeromonas caviae]|uniref:Uncharacterized protein n=2 Tax=Aeromonas TaxID=642 RepID=A0AAI9KWA6_AERCA|nr:hypothetical protein KAM348_41410 [Aeromonas caviae]
MLSPVEDKGEVKMETPVGTIFYLPDISHKVFESSLYYAQVMTQVIGGVIHG